MDRDGVVVRVEHDDLEQTARGVRADDQDPIVALPHQAQRNADGDVNVLVGNAMPANIVRDLQR